MGHTALVILSHDVWMVPCLRMVYINSLASMGSASQAQKDSLLWVEIHVNQRLSSPVSAIGREGPDLTSTQGDLI